MAFKINKKLIALETLILAISISVCTVIYFVGEHYDNIKRDIRYNAKEQIESQIDSLKNKIDSLKNINICLWTYNLLVDHDDYIIKGYSYYSYKKKILNDKDSSFRKTLYYRVSSYNPKFINDWTFDQFINEFEYDSISIENIENIDKLKSGLENKLKFISNQPYGIDRLHFNIIQIFLLIFYPIRYLFQMTYWSIKTLRKNENN